MRSWRTSVRALLAACIGVGVLGVGLAAATHNKYPIESVTIKVDRGTDTISGTVDADSTSVHFCTYANQWPVNVYRVKSGPDKKVVHKKTNFDGDWRFKVPDSLQGERLYAEVPSFTNGDHGSCIGGRSRKVNGP